MGKFFEALKKSEAEDQAPSRPETIQAEPVTVKAARDSMEALRLNTRPTPPEKSRESVPSEMDERLKAFIAPGSLSAECFKLLRAKIFTKRGVAPRSITVTSPLPAEGKTTVALNLAINIAQSVNEHVVLVGCDLRRPVLGKILGIGACDGLREYLEQGVTIAPYLVNTFIDKLTLLPAGNPPPNPSELLSSEKMRKLVHELKARYEDRYIIYDATPAQFASETMTLCSITDAVLLVVRHGKTPKKAIEETVKNIGQEKIMGIVFNGNSEMSHDYKDYYHYYSK